MATKELLALAVKLHESGDLTRAAPVYEQILALDARHAEALHYLGLMAFQTGRLEDAETLMREALLVREGEAFFHSNLGLVLQAKGDARGAIEAYERALALNPDLAETSNNLGNVLAGEGRIEEALASFERAVQVRPGFFEAHNSAGIALQLQGRFGEAAGRFAQAVALAPAHADLWGNLASAFQSDGKMDEAIGAYRMAVDLRPGFAGANYNLGSALLEQGELEEAAARLAEAVRAEPGYALAHNNLGNVYKEMGRFEEAMACYEAVLALQPEEAQGYYNLGCLLGDLGDRDGALKRYGQALALTPGDAQVEFSVGLIQVMRGEFAEGWRRYEQRWGARDHDTPDRGFPQPLWQGERLEGPLLLWAEQGVGDEILFAGMVWDVVKMVNDVILDCDARLMPLFARSFPGVRVVTGFDAARSVEAGVAAQISTGSLPGLFRQSDEDFGRGVAPYLVADAVRRKQMRERYADGRLAVGVAWFTRGKKTGKTRSVALDMLGPWFGMDGIRWVSLQYGDAARLREEIGAADVLLDEGVDQMTDMDGFSAQVAAMDLVITIDSSAAHLAGALGVPCWVMLPFAADWRWFEGRSDSPWYPGMRLFRQGRRGEWGTVVEEVRVALEELLR